MAGFHVAFACQYDLAGVVPASARPLRAPNNLPASVPSRILDIVQPTRWYITSMDACCLRAMRPAGILQPSRRGARTVLEC